MNRAEDRLIGGLDRSREKAATSARTLAVRELAKAEINCAVMSQPEEDRETYIRATGDQLRTLAGKHMGEAAAVGMFGGLAWSAELKISRDNARATAEQQMARLTAANENNGAVRVGDALASAIRKLDEPARTKLSPVADDLERRR